MNAADPPLLVEHDGPVTVVTVNRPARRNAVDGATAALLFQAFRDFEASDSSAVAVLTGSAGTFCAGADLKALAEGDGARPLSVGGVNTLAPMGPTRLLLSKPVIAAIEGHAVAGGLELALWCDLRIAAEDAVFGVFCRRFGVPLIDGGTIRLPRLIGQSRALDMILTGRAVLAQEALAIGLANRIAPKGGALAAALDLARALIRHPQACLRADRLSALRQWSLDEGSALIEEMSGGLDVIRSGETLAGATRFRDGAGRHGAPE